MVDIRLPKASELAYIFAPGLPASEHLVIAKRALTAARYAAHHLTSNPQIIDPYQMEREGN